MTGTRLLVVVALLAMLLLLAGPAPVVSAQDGGQAARQQEVIRQTLAAKRIDLDFDETAFPEVIEYMRARAGINMVVDPNVLEDVEDETITLTLKNMAVGSALNIILDFVELKYTFRHGVLWITSPEEAWRGTTVMRIYDVRDLTMRIRNFPGTRIRLRGDEGGGGGGPVWEDEDEPVEVPTIDDLEEIILEVTSPDSWDNNPDASILQIMGLLIIRQTPEVHREIAHLLAQLRANR